jgi:hypothetical protein
MSNDAPATPGSGRIVCRPLDELATGAGVRYAIKITDLIVELLGLG